MDHFFLSRSVRGIALPEKSGNSARINRKEVNLGYLGKQECAGSRICLFRFLSTRPNHPLESAETLRSQVHGYLPSIYLANQMAHHGEFVPRLTFCVRDNISVRPDPENAFPLPDPITLSPMLDSTVGTLKIKDAVLRLRLGCACSIS
jgi:hypothetical protein